MAKKIVFQIKGIGAIGNEKLDSHPLYANAIVVEQDTQAAAEEALRDHAAYIKDALTGRRQRDDIKYPGIVWKPQPTANTGTDYVNIEPDEYIEEGENWTVSVLDKWADEQGLEHEYIRKFDPATNKPAAYNSHHIFL